MDTETANTPKNVTYAFSGVAKAGLNDRANRANQMEVSKSCCPIILYVEAGIYNGIFCTGDLQVNILTQDYHSDDDISAISDPDSDISETVDKADFVEIWEEDSSMLAGFEKELSTQVIFM